MTFRELQTDMMDNGDDLSVGAAELAAKFAAQLGGAELPEPSNSGSETPATEPEAKAAQSMFDLVEEDEDEAPTVSEPDNSGDGGQVESVLTAIKEKLDLPATASVDDVLSAIEGGVMRRSDYDRKRAAESAERKRFERENKEALAVYKLLKEDPSELLNIALELSGGASVEEVISKLGVQAPTTPSSDGDGDAPADLSAQIEAAVQAALGDIDLVGLQKLREEQEMRERREALDAKFNEIDPNMTDAQKEALLKHAVKLGLTTVEQLDLAFNDLKAKWEARQRAAKAAAGTAPTKSGAVGSANTPSSARSSFLEREAEHNDIAAAVLAALKERSLS